MRLMMIAWFCVALLTPSLAAATQEAEEEALVFFTKALATVRDQYVEEVDAGDLVRGAVQEMLSSLDPHSDYLDREMHERLREEHSGGFFGVGMTISSRGGYLTVISPIEGTPAARAGIRAGDRIWAIDGQPTTGMSTSEAAHLIRGPKGTEVVLTIVRDDGEPVDYQLVRERIPLYSIPYSFMLQPTTGYIRVASFGRTTADELDSALEELTAAGMRDLILDLRWNSGGLYDAAVEVSDRFLTDGKVIVTTRGRARGSHRASLATPESTRPGLPLVVLVNQGSASASEIVAGAIQDHRRGVVAGTPTFGKGLVQSLFKLSDGGALKLTTARYYTPSGRCIQRSYKGQREEEYERQRLRSIEGEGGILPDVELQMERPVPRVVDAARRKGLFFEFAKGYLHETTVGPATTSAPDSFLDSYRLPDGFIEDLRQFLASHDITYSPDELNEAALDLEIYVRAEIAGLVWDQEARYRALVELDDQLGRALDLLTMAREMVGNQQS
jgi:carboxyl-terminal processing protease